MRFGFRAFSDAGYAGCVNRDRGVFDALFVDIYQDVKRRITDEGGNDG